MEINENQVPSEDTSANGGVSSAEVKHPLPPQPSELYSKLKDTPIPSKDLESLFAQVSTELQEALENNPVYARLVFQQYWQNGSVPEEIRFNWNGYRWAIARTSDRSQNWTLGQGKDREIIIRRRKDDGVQRTLGQEHTEENGNPKYWEDRLTMGADYESDRRVGTVKPTEWPHQLHDPDITFREGTNSFPRNTPSTIDGARRIIAVLKTSPLTDTPQALPSPAKPR